MTLQFAVLLTYASLLMGFGLWIGKRVKRTSDFFVAGRRLGPRRGARKPGTGEGCGDLRPALSRGHDGGVVGRSPEVIPA